MIYEARWYIILPMTNSFVFKSEKLLKANSDNPEIALILKDIENAKQGVMTFSKEVKKYMLSFIHKRYDDNKEVASLIEYLKKWSRFQSFNNLEIFQLQDECYFWYDFLHAYGVWLVIGEKHGFESEEEALRVLIRLVKLEDAVFAEYKV